MGFINLKRNKNTCVYFRSEEDMEKIDVHEADSAYKEMSQTILAEELKKVGFIKYKSTSFVRVSSINNLEIINLQKESHGSRTFTVNIAIMPLYVYSEYLIFTFGSRLSYFIESKIDCWWDFQNRDIAEKSFSEVTGFIMEKVIPWFDSFDSFDKMLAFVLKESYCNYHSSRRRYEYACFVAMAMGDFEKLTKYYNKLKKECVKEPNSSDDEIVNTISEVILMDENSMASYIEEQISNTAQALKLPKKIFVI